VMQRKSMHNIRQELKRNTMAVFILYAQEIPNVANVFS
jgi:hypothetical protein